MIPFISSMGAGNRLTAANYVVADISKTSGCPLAKAVRKHLRKEGITRGIKVVYSPDLPQEPGQDMPDCSTNGISPGGDAHSVKKRQILGSIFFVPSVVGLLIAGEVVRDLLDIKSTSSGATLKPNSKLGIRTIKNTLKIAFAGGKPI